MKIDRQEYLDKVYACWVGKNIGGTMGGPYEWVRDMVDCQGFTSPKGEPLPNDDLDLQLVWLRALENYGVRSITPQLLGEYWLEYVTGPWNEYGIAKGNLRAGLLPPYSGEYDNGKWKNSNGAWIRTEIWACLFPGAPELAVRFAYKDACVDHGMGEGTAAAMFVAALESAAFAETDIRKLIDGALAYAPENFRLVASVKKAIALSDAKTPFADARNAIVAETADLGWFQAPANVSFAVLGLLYGEGDFKSTMLHAINCGDDTDCTAATVGALMGIMHGKAGIPSDWAEYIGDDIKSAAIDMSISYIYPRTCTELTHRIAELMPTAFRAYEIPFAFIEGESDWSGHEERKGDQLGLVPDFDLPSTGLSMDFPDLHYARGRVEFDRCEVAPGDTVQLTFVFRSVTRDTKHLTVQLHLPEGWTADRSSVHLCLHPKNDNGRCRATATVTVGERVEGKNTLYAFASAEGRPTTALLPIVIWGK